MSRASGVKSVVYHGDSCLGEAEVFPVKNQSLQFQFPNNEIRIDHLSPHSERCPPLSVFHIVSPSSLRCRLQAKNNVTEQSPLARLYLSCFKELKTAVVLIGDEELHLVAMPSKVEKVPSFWCCSVRAGLYNSCLRMLNLRCLSIVFDLDETLIVANTMKSFEDRIEFLSHRIDAENDPVRISGMSAELKRYLEDRELLKQYIEGDGVMDNGKVVSVQNEGVPPLPGSQQCILRPVIRLQERNIVLTRINPEIRDTSVLVRLRPAWEDLRSYLTAKGRKRFEVFVCTMAERDYALEMWRLLDPGSYLISSEQLLDRVVCVKSGSRKSLLHVFQNGICHPKMAMVIDDRQAVWDEKDQPHVHVVPPFTPYYAPQAEMANAVPVLCVARNVACNVRGGFFKLLDENLLGRIFELCYENEISDLPFAPDASNYLISEDTGAVLNDSKDAPIREGTNNVEVERKLNRPAHNGEERPIQHQPPSTQSLFSDLEHPVNGESIHNKDPHIKSGSLTLPQSSMYIAVLQEIGRRCDAKIEFRSVLRSSKDLHFLVEVLFSTEKIGIGVGKTRKDAEVQAAENSLRNLASNYMSIIAPHTMGVDGDANKLSHGKENGFLEDSVVPAPDEAFKKEVVSNASITEQTCELVRGGPEGSILGSRPEFSNSK